MARGKKYDMETKEKALAMISTNNNVAEISKLLNIPETTLGTWKNQEEKDEEFAELRAKKKAEFVRNSWQTIEMALELGRKRVKRALEHEDALDKMIDIIEDEYPDPKDNKIKTALINKIRILQIQGIRDISTFVGTLYDKQALAAGEATGRQELTGRDGKPLVVRLEGELGDWSK